MFYFPFFPWHTIDLKKKKKKKKTRSETRNLQVSTILYHLYISFLLVYWNLDFYLFFLLQPFEYARVNTNLNNPEHI